MAEWKINLTMVGRLLSPSLVSSCASLLHDSSTHEKLGMKKKYNFFWTHSAHSSAARANPGSGNSLAKCFQSSV